jgi:hypothetical protein
MRINYAPAPPEEKASSKVGDQKKTDPVKYNYTISF